MSLEEIRDELKIIIEGLYYGDIEFSYDAMGFTMAFSHPAELLGDMCGELEQMIEYNNPDPDGLDTILGGLKEMRFSFDLVQLGTAINGLEAYIEKIK